MDSDLYDEFGNLIGAESDDSVYEDEEQLVETVDSSAQGEMEEEESSERALVTRDSLETSFPNDVEVLVETEDQQSLETPLVEPAQTRQKPSSIYTKSAKNIPRSSYDRDYLISLLSIPERTINVAVLGPLHSGKTSLMDLLLSNSHEKLPNVSKSVRQGWKPLKYLDNTKVEIERGISCKLNGFSFLGCDLQDKSVAITMLDTPGHVNFMDEVAVGLTASDSCLIVLDVVEGVTAIAQQLIKQAQKHQQNIVFVLNKIDRLILELKLPPKDAYLKLVHIVHQIQSYAHGEYSPELGNILFASAKLGFTFSIKEFILYHYSTQLGEKNVQSFIDRMWGTIYFQAGEFSHEPNEMGSTTFMQFILVPLYKVLTQTLSSEPKQVALILKRHFNVNLAEEYLKWDPQPLLRKVLALIFRNQQGLIDSINIFGSSASEMKTVKLENQGVMSAKPSKLAHVLKLIDYCGDTWALVRIYRGSMRVNDTFKALDAGTTYYDDAPETKILDIGLLGGRYVLPVEKAAEGQIVLVKGIDQFFTKSGTLADTLAAQFTEIDYINEPTFKIVLKPLQPRELPLMLGGLNSVNKLYSGMVTCVEESGETVVLGTGELYLDCLLWDLRNNYSKIEIQVSNPLVKFAETCIGESFASIPVNGTNGTLSVSIAAQPLERELAEDLTNGIIAENATQNKRHLSKLLRERYKWDSLAARNIWSLHKGNVFVNDTLPHDVDQELLTEMHDSICQGFEWAVREGPLAEEAIHGVHFRLLSASTDDGVGTGQLISLVRKACYVALLTAEPALLEPIYEVSLVVHDLLVEVVEEIFAKRRGGRIYNRVAIPATPLVEVRGQIPVIDSIGFETDLRLATNGEAMCQLHFCNKIWRKVPGDVMNEDATIPKLKPAPWESMSRDFVMKTRRRKGLSSDGYATQDGPSLARYIDADLFQKLKDNKLV
ncbi:LANO_0G04192g1_1 [Lachancea nothofagi CBS 11611]|uniref:LANO_0G04192g1_1 n=1 Tax=Lachancea nothofagi CBS 11611 TaxID=1266666 RepID=A0A1G4KG86_9SACH|nr:LANO_0G04192g1_1 [Lachancea nothofagi CBS 11611]